MQHHLKRSLIAAACMVILVALPCISFAKQIRQVELGPALIAAIRRDDADNVDRLLAAGANPNTRDEPEKRQSVLQILKGLIHPKSTHAPTAAMVAVGFGNRDWCSPPHSTHIVKSLINSGADVNAQTDKGVTALIVSADTGNADTTNALIAAEADVNHRDNYGDTALIAATIGDNTDTLKALIGAHADVNAKSKDGKTAIIVAAELVHIDSARVLIAAGADVNVKDNKGKTALMWAKAHRGFEVAAMLRKAGAKE